MTIYRPDFINISFCNFNQTLDGANKVVGRITVRLTKSSLTRFTVGDVNTTTSAGNVLGFKHEISQTDDILVANRPDRKSSTNLLSSMDSTQDDRQFWFSQFAHQGMLEYIQFNETGNKTYSIQNSVEQVTQLEQYLQILNTELQSGCNN